MIPSAIFTAAESMGSIPSAFLSGKGGQRDFEIGLLKSA
jgi:hypothetical protein